MLRGHTEDALPWTAYNPTTKFLIVNMVGESWGWGCLAYTYAHTHIPNTPIHLHTCAHTYTYAHKDTYALTNERTVMFPQTRVFDSS